MSMPSGTDDATAPNPGGSGRVPERGAAIVPSKDEEERLGATLAALARISVVDLVVVVDDGSTDGTLRDANLAEVQTVKHQVNMGKAQAMTSGVTVVSLLEAEVRGASHSDTPRPCSLLMPSSGRARPTSRSCACRCSPAQADMAIATLPPQKTAGGGSASRCEGAREGIAKLADRTMAQPFSGMRCIIAREVLEAVLPPATGWGVEVGLTVDVLRNRDASSRCPLNCTPGHRTGTEGPTAPDAAAPRRRARPQVPWPD